MLRLALLLASLTLLAACGSAPSKKEGGYYLDDGPPSSLPSNPEDIPDARPKLEPLRTAAMKPYTALGKRFTPMTSLIPYRARGMASWYGRRYHGRLTASGETYDMLSMTAAHPTLPIPSYVRVTHVANGRSAIVRVNDRGPFHADRLIDLSYAAAAKLGFAREGSAEVEVELIIPGAALSMIRIQLGAFQQLDNAHSLVARLKIQADWLADQLSVSTENGLHRVFAGPYSTREEARSIADRIARSPTIQPSTQPLLTPASEP